MSYRQTFGLPPNESERVCETVHQVGVFLRAFQTSPDVT